MSDFVDYAFLHGGGQGGWVWDETIDALSSQTEGRFGRALTLDVPGCGAKRGRDTAALSVDDIADELATDLEKAGMKDVLLVGHSQAGTILPLLVQRRRELFRRLVYVTCCAPMPGQTIFEMMNDARVSADEAGFPAVGDLSQHLPRMFCNDMDVPGTAAFMAKLGQDAWPNQSYTATDWRYDHLGAVAATYVVCLKDNTLPPACQEIYAARVKAERLVRIDAGHQVMNSSPHALAEALRREAAA